MDNFKKLLKFCEEYGKTEHLHERHSLRYKEKFCEYVVKCQLSSTFLELRTETEHKIITASLNIACSKAQDILAGQMRLGGDASIEIYGVTENKLYVGTSDFDDIDMRFDRVLLVDITYFDY